MKEHDSGQETLAPCCPPWAACHRERRMSLGMRRWCQGHGKSLSEAERALTRRGDALHAFSHRPAFSVKPSCLCPRLFLIMAAKHPLSSRPCGSHAHFLPFPPPLRDCISCGGGVERGGTGGEMTLLDGARCYRLMWTLCQAGIQGRSALSVTTPRLTTSGPPTLGKGAKGSGGVEVA